MRESGCFLVVLQAPGAARQRGQTAAAVPNVERFESRGSLLGAESGSAKCPGAGWFERLEINVQVAMNSARRCLQYLLQFSAE